MPHRLKSFISRFRDEMIGFCFVLSLITAIVTITLFIRQSKLLKGVETTVKNDTLQLRNQDSIKKHVMEDTTFVNTLKDFETARKKFIKNGK